MLTCSFYVDFIMLNNGDDITLHQMQLLQAK